MKKIIWIDVGTHFAQEHNSIFGSNYTFYSFILRRFISGKILRRGKFVNYKELRDILSARRRIRERSGEFFTILIEANSKIAHKMNFYPQADIFFNLALTDTNNSPVSVAKLYIGKGGELAEGNSLFIEKHKVHKDSYIPTFGVSTNDFFGALESYLKNKFDDYDVLLRLNCEGVEDEVIYSAYSNFASKLKLICGSLKDVEEIKGPAAAEKLDNFMTDNKLLFIKFSSGIYSWPKAHLGVLSLLGDKEKSI